MAQVQSTDDVRRIVIIGALSAIAEATARMWAGPNARLILAGRQAENLEVVAADLRTRGAHVETDVVDLATADARSVLDEYRQQLGGIDIVLVAYGVLSDQQRAEECWSVAHESLKVNFESAAGWCLAAAQILDVQAHGTLLVLGSVAGDRGRASNYVYGAAKSGLGTLVQGIAHRLAKRGARAVLIKPGFVDTPMTSAIQNKGLLWVKPERIASVIVKAGKEGARTAPVIYAPGWWRLIMLVVRLVPSAIFHRTGL